MEVDRKKELSNFRRLQSLKDKKIGRSWQAKQIKTSLSCLDSKAGVLNKKIVFQSDDDSVDEEMHPNDEDKKGPNTTSLRELLPSDSEEEDDNSVDYFRIKPKPCGQDRSQFPEGISDERFQLNDIFMEDVEAEEEQAVESSEEKDEKQKNLEILQNILGYQLPKTVPVPPTVNPKKKKKYVHFNPEDENSWKYLRKTEPETEKTKEKEESTTAAEPEVSPLRFFEVSADLKSVLQGTDEEFRFSKTFESSDGQCETDDKGFAISDTWQNGHSPSGDKNSMKSKMKSSEHKESLSLTSTAEVGHKEHQKFFILPGDARLTEGVEFFKREKTEEEIRADFFKTRDTVLDLLKQRHRRGLRSQYVVKNKRR